MYKDFKRMYWAIVLLIRSLISPRPSCRRPRGLDKIPYHQYYHKN